MGGGLIPRAGDSTPSRPLCKFGKSLDHHPQSPHTRAARPVCTAARCAAVASAVPLTLAHSGLAGSLSGRSSSSSAGRRARRSSTAAPWAGTRACFGTTRSRAIASGRRRSLMDMDMKQTTDGTVCLGTLQAARANAATGAASPCWVSCLCHQATASRPKPQPGQSAPARPWQVLLPSELPGLRMQQLLSV